ncbi:protein kinase [Thermosynechococcaceae cyanobacterium BACA0444]|uniref:Protein kinase n=1 Tax=Pseudocalidococcus azoricus BACA0444 TaxID=2918990 RepID=A0AAE4FTP3_9CYAN|nr:protein kinase [Pseudocalidococcus azoricus]MDS3861382.1 protein kinase [Pseudocalidococcus azoricus BACA0444]
MTVTPLALGNSLQGGKYRLDALLSQGGFGVTYRATHTLLHQTMVLKTINPAQHDPQQLAQIGQRFIHEAQRLAKFQHPHIVRVSDCFIEGGLPFIVMDYIPGQTLAALVRNRPLSPDQAIHYIKQVGSALALVHDHGLLHRDVKPDNIMLRQGTDSVVLIDFGIAREYTPGKVETNTGMLSAGYAPVEQYLPKHQWSPATDIYALAATLYALLAAKPPVASVLRDRVPLDSLQKFQRNLSPGLEAAVLAGMALDARDRPQSVAEWLDLLDETESGNGRAGVSAMTTSTVAVLPQARPIIPATQPELASARKSRSQPSSSRSMWHSPWFWLLGTAIVGSGIGAGLGLWLRQQTSIPGAPPLIQQDESFPPTRPPVTPQPPVLDLPPPFESSPTPSLPSPEISPPLPEEETPRPELPTPTPDGNGTPAPEVTPTPPSTETPPPEPAPSVSPEPIPVDPPKPPPAPDPKPDPPTPAATEPKNPGNP